MKSRVMERGKNISERERREIMCYTSIPQISSIARVASSQSQDPRVPSGSPLWMSEGQVFGPCFAPL